MQVYKRKSETELYHVQRQERSARTEQRRERAQVEAENQGRQGRKRSRETCKLWICWRQAGRGMDLRGTGKENAMAERRDER